MQADLESYLVGDILAVTPRDLVVIWTGAALVIALLVWRWQALLISTLFGDLATASGISPRREQLILTQTLALALTVAVAIKVVGALLIAAMLLIPAAAARPLRVGRRQWSPMRWQSAASQPLAGWQAHLFWGVSP